MWGKHFIASASNIKHHIIIWKKILIMNFYILFTNTKSYAKSDEYAIKKNNRL